MPPRQRPERQQFFSDLADGMREAWSRGWLRAGFLLSGVANVGLGTWFVLGPVIAVGADAVLVTAAALIAVACAAGIATPSVRALRAPRRPDPPVGGAPRMA